MRQLLPGETKHRCNCGVYFIVQTWKVGKERELCYTCRNAWRHIFSMIDDGLTVSEAELPALHQQVVDMYKGRTLVEA